MDRRPMPDFGYNATQYKILYIVCTFGRGKICIFQKLDTKIGNLMMNLWLFYSYGRRIGLAECT